MKKLLLNLLCGTIIYSLTFLATLAENFTYKVYNPKTNKTYSATLGTLSMTDTQYIWGFYTLDGQPLCVISFNNINKNSQGLVGGQGTDYTAFERFFVNKEYNINLAKHEVGWRELSTDTFYREINCIKRERAAQGKYPME